MSLARYVAHRGYYKQHVEVWGKRRWKTTWKT